MKVDKEIMLTQNAICNGLHLLKEQYEDTDFDIVFKEGQYGEGQVSLRVKVSDVLRDAISSIKERPEIVRCKDCIFWKDQGQTSRWIPCVSAKTDKDWFCASGKRKDKNER